MKHSGFRQLFLENEDLTLELVTTKEKLASCSKTNIGLASEVAALRAALAAARSPLNPLTTNTMAMASSLAPAHVASVAVDAFATYARNLPCPHSWSVFSVVLLTG